MMVMTAKVDMKKVLLILAAAAALVLAAVLLLGGGEDTTTPTAAPSVSSNDQRVKFLENFGWAVTTSPTESSQVKIPEESSELFTRYNNLQKGQGYDLTDYAGKNVTRYVYQVNNFPGATGEVFATLLVYKDQIIGGDVTDTSARGKIRGFKMPDVKPTESIPAETTPETTQ